MRNEQLIQKLNACAAACNYCADACLDEDNLKNMVKCIRTDRECAAICEATAKVAAQNGKLTDELVQLCERICRACAEECEKHDHDHCQECARACRECEEACRNFSVNV